MTICTCVCPLPPIMVFCHTEIGICVHVSAVYHRKSSMIGSPAQAISIIFTSQRLFVNIDLMQIFFRLAQVYVYPFLCSTQMKLKHLKQTLELCLSFF